MNFRIVAIPLLAAICLDTPAAAGGVDREEQRRDRGGDNNRGGVNIGHRGPRYYAPSYLSRCVRT